MGQGMLGAGCHSAIIQVSNDGGSHQGGSTGGSDQSRMVNELRWGGETSLCSGQ